MSDDRYGFKRDFAELTHYRSIGTPEQIEAVVEAAEAHLTCCGPGSTDYGRGKRAMDTRKEIRTALTTLKGNE